jgi:hypothetical protein
MKTCLSPSEARQRYINALGKDFGNIYYALTSELAWLQKKWDEYITLFGTKTTRVELLNSSAPSFFSMVQSIFHDDILLHIYRLTCPKKSCGKHDQLTIKQLPELVDDKIKETVSKQIETAAEKSKFCHDWRHNKIAHPNLDIALKRNVDPLAPATRKEVDRAIKNITSVLNTISKYYLDADRCSKRITRTNGAKALLYILDDGLNAKNRREQRIKDRKHTQEDLKTRDL